MNEGQGKSNSSTLKNLLIQLGALGLGGVAGGKGAAGLVRRFGKNMQARPLFGGKPAYLPHLDLPGLGPVDPIRAGIAGSLAGGGAGLATSRSLLSDKQASDVQVLAKIAAYATQED